MNERLFERIIQTVGVAMSVYHIYAIAWAPPEALVFRAVHLAFALTLVFLIFPFGKRRGPVDLLFVAAGLAINLYLLVYYDYVVNRILYIDDLTLADQVVATLAILIVLEGTRRTIGWALPLTAVFFLAWGLFVAGAKPLLVLDQLYLATEGIYGTTLGVSATYVLAFVLFGSFMERTGTGQLFMDFALAITGASAGGPGKVAVVSSSLFGTISGSAVANVMVDGPITIPLMKRTGFKAHFAAGVESVASTGGQIMPPIMGAAAFVMAEFMAVPYATVALWALLPAVLYYVACFAAVHFEARRNRITGVPRSEVPLLGAVMRERGHLFLPVLIILAGMFYGYSAPLCALAGTAATIPVALMRRTTRAGITWMTLWDALQDGARHTLAVATACACAGIVIGMITLTGEGLKFTQVIVALARETLLLALVLTAVAGIVLGMGMPTTPAYIVMVSLLVPALMKLGVVEPAAHMFAFYFAILSAITPPVALAVYAAAGLAKANIWSAGLAAMRIGAAGYIVPFMFAYNPELLMIGAWEDILYRAVTATLGILCLATSLSGFFLRATPLWERGVLFAAAVLFCFPDWRADVVALALLAGMVALQWPARLAERRAHATPQLGE
jgi:TRAP transporter 4TM/12TM fusion protein